MPHEKNNEILKINADDDVARTILENIEQNITTEIIFHPGNEKYIKNIKISSTNRSTVIEYLAQIEEYLNRHLLNNDSEAFFSALTKRFKIFEHQEEDGEKRHYFLNQALWDSDLFLQLLVIREIFIASLLTPASSTFEYLSYLGFELHTWRSCFKTERTMNAFKIKELRCFAYRKYQNKNLANQELDHALWDKINTTKEHNSTEYFAFWISSSLYAEPYILKISRGQIEAVIRSNSDIDSHLQHGYFRDFIKTHFEHCVFYRTLPLVHDGNCTRYTEYALLQFKHFSKTLGSVESAFERLKQQNPYVCNTKTLRDFQIFFSLGYDAIKKEILPLPEQITALFSAEKKLGEALSDLYDDMSINYERHSHYLSRMKIVAEKPMIINKLIKIEELLEKYVSDDSYTQVFENFRKNLPPLQTLGKQYYLFNEDDHPFFEVLQVRAILIKKLLANVFYDQEVNDCNPLFCVEMEPNDSLFQGTDEVSISGIEQFPFFDFRDNLQIVKEQLESELVARINASQPKKSTEYFAFWILSNAPFSAEPYILKIVQGKIEEIIKSVVQYNHATHLAVDDCIRKYSSLTCEYHETLPLDHHEHAVRYSQYALLQFNYLCEKSGSELAFDMLKQKNPYLCNPTILRDFQILFFLGYDAIKEQLLSLPKEVAALLSVNATQVELLENESKDFSEELPSGISGEIQIESFKKIYRALYKTQSSIFSSNFLKKLNKVKNADEQLGCIEKQRSKYARSKTAFAWTLAEKYQGLSDIELIREIHNDTHQKRFFHRSKNRALLESVSSVEELKSHLIDKKSTTGTILKCLGV